MNHNPLMLIRRKLVYILAHDWLLPIIALEHEVQLSCGFGGRARCSDPPSLASLGSQNSAENKMVALQALYNAIPLGAFIALMTVISGWGYEHWGASIFWLMAAMGFVALFIKVEPQNDESNVVDLSANAPEAQN